MLQSDAVRQQADQFRGFYRKQGGDMEQVFMAWCDSKDLPQLDRDRIWLALHAVELPRNQGRAA